MSNVPPKLTADDLIPDVRLRQADKDAFRHAPIAAQVADLAAAAETPVNIALFGPWGSGKSSFFELLRTNLAARDKSIKLVRYDAWKFGGSSLKRNFLSNAANKLGFHQTRQGGHDFNLGLYETKRTVRFDPVQIVKSGRWKPLGKFALFVLLLTAAAILAVAAVTSIGPEGLSEELEKVAPGLIKLALGGVLAAGTAAKFLDGARIESQQTQPSEDEEFAELFTKLIDGATKTKHIPGQTTTTRLVFFIDELDRCSKQDVVATLTSLRTFLDQQKCVFIVAADREVLEEALDEVEQATPVREEEPYYSSASEFLDKIFQHQFSLPPLRTQRLTGFARELVEDRGGLWADLRNAETNGRRLAAVMYALIPPHVRSPRRVKVLLNNFATNVRVSQARGIDWLGRSTEIAMLTVLQTEFPRLAADLHHEPRLPSLLLDPPEGRTERQQALIARHGFEEPALPVTAHAGNEDEPEDEALVSAHPVPEPPDRLLAGRSNAALRHRQREDLRRYLTSRKAAGVTDPGRDLLYLEAAGEPAGLNDPELGQLIEEYAADEPARVIAALEGRPADERAAAARLLGLMSEKEAGPERVNMVTALAGALDGLRPEPLRGQLGDLVENIASYQAEEEFADEQLPGILTLAQAAGSAGEELARAILRMPALLATPSRVSSVAGLLPVLSGDDAVRVEQAVARLYLTEPEILLTLIENEDASVVGRLLRSQGEDLVELLTPTVAAPAPPAAAAGTASAQVDAEAEVADDVPEKIGLLDCLFERLATRSDGLAETSAHLMALFLDEVQIGYDAVKRHAPVVTAHLGADATNTLCLSAIAVGPPTDWEWWSSMLVAGGGGTGQNRAVVQVLDAVGDAPTNVQSDAPSVVERAMQTGSLDRDRQGLIAAIEEQLAKNDWWDTSVVATQVLLHRLVRSIAAAAPDFADNLDGALVADMQRSTPSGDVAWDEDVAEAVVRLATGSSDAVLNAGAEVVAAALADEPSTHATAAAITLGGEQASRKLPCTPVPATDVVPLITAGGSNSDRVLSTWLATQPLPDDVLEVLGATTFRQAAAPALSGWAAGTASGGVVKLYSAILDEEALDVRWLQALRVGADVSQELAELVGERMRAASAAPARERALHAAQALNLGSPRSRRAIAGAAQLLLTDGPNKAKSDVAIALIQALDGDYGGQKGALREASLAADAQGQISDRARKHFERLGLVNKKPRKLGPFTLPG